MNSQSKKMELLGSASIPKALLAMGIPTMIGMLVNAFYNLVDAYFVGGLGESQMGAISVVYPLGQVLHLDVMNLLVKRNLLKFQELVFILNLHLLKLHIVLLKIKKMIIMLKSLTLFLNAEARNVLILL